MTELGGHLRLTKVPPQPEKVLRAAGIDRIVKLEGRDVNHEV